MIRVRKRWGTRFGRFVSDFGVARLVIALGREGQPVTDRAVYAWIAGDVVPRPQKAAVMVRISRGRLAFEDVYRHREELRHGRTQGSTLDGLKPRPGGS